MGGLILNIVSAGIGAAIAIVLLKKQETKSDDRNAEDIQRLQNKLFDAEQAQKRAEKDKRECTEELNTKEEELKAMRKKIFDKEDLADDTAEDLELLKKKYERAQTQIEKLEYENLQLKNIINKKE